MSITIDNSQDSAVKSGNWSNPGASLFDAIMEEDNYEALLNEAYLLHGDVSKKDKTSYSASGCKYPHHVIRGDKLVVSEAGVKAAYQRAKQMGIFKGNVKSHLEKHYKELGIYKDSTMNESMETIDKNFQFIESFLGINENELIDGMIEQPSVSAFNESVDSPLYQEFIGVETPEALLAWMDDHIDYDHDIEMWRLKDPETTIEVGKGNCHDQSLLEKVWFDHHDISNKQIFFIEYNEGEEVGGSTHTFSTFIGTDGEFYWFEHAWENYRGIHGPFKTRDQLVDYVHECWKKDDDINQGKYQDIAFFYIPNYEIGMTLGTYVESWYIDKAINESLSWIDSIVHNDKFRDQEFNEKSHSTLKYCYRVGFDAETGDEVAVQFILDPDKLLKVGDNDALLHLSSEEFDKKNSDALAVFKDQTKKLGHIDFSTDEMKIDKIFNRNGKSLSEVKLIPLMNTNLCNQIRSRYKHITKDQTLDQYIQSDEFKNKVKAVYDLYKQAETYKVGDVGGKNQYKMTKLIWNPELLFSYRFTPVLRGFNVPGRSKGLYTPNVRHHSQADIDAYKASDMMNKFKAEYALNEMFTYDCDNESDSSYTVNYPNGSIMYECPAYVNLEKLYLDPIFNPTYEYDKPIAIVEYGGEINLDDIMTMNGVNSARIWSAMFENATDHIVSDVKYFMDLGYTTFNESEDETVNDIVRTVFNEKSHGGLKFSFRMGINKENGHLEEANLTKEFRYVIDETNGHFIKVVYDMNPDNIVGFGGNAIPDDESLRNMKTSGHTNYVSKGNKVVALVDMCNNKRLQSVSAYPPIHNIGGSLAPITVQRYLNIMKRFVDEQKLNEISEKLKKECPTGIAPSLEFPAAIEKSKEKGQQPISYKVGEIDNSETFKTTNPKHTIRSMFGGIVKESVDEFDEASHGKLKYDFRYAYDAKTGHKLKIVYGLEGINVDYAGHAYNQQDSNILSSNPESEALVRKTVSKTGNIDHKSYGQKVLAIIDEVTGSRLSEANTIPYFRSVPPEYTGSDEISEDLIKNYLNKSGNKIVPIKVGSVDENPSFKSTVLFKSPQQAMDAEMTQKTGRGVKPRDIIPFMNISTRNEQKSIFYHPNHKDRREFIRSFIIERLKMSSDDEFVDFVKTWNNGGFDDSSIGDAYGKQKITMGTINGLIKKLTDDQQSSLVKKLIRCKKLLQDNKILESYGSDLITGTSIGKNVINYYESLQDAVFNNKFYREGNIGLVRDVLVECGFPAHCIEILESTDAGYDEVEDGWQFYMVCPYAGLVESKILTEDINSKIDKFKYIMSIIGTPADSDDRISRYGFFVTEGYNAESMCDTSGSGYPIELNFNNCTMNPERRYYSAQMDSKHPDEFIESGNILDEYIHEADEEDPPAMEDQSEEESSEDKKEDILDEPIDDSSSENEKKEEQEDEPPAIEPKSLPKQTDEAEINKNGVNRKKLYIAFIEWCKEYNQKNTFGSNFDKDIFKVTYPFIPNEMRYFYRLANPNICVLSGDLTFFPLADLRKLNADNKQIQELLIFAATPNDMRVFSTKDKKVYLAVEDDGGALKLTKVLGETFDLYLQTMIKKGDILNAPPESNEEEGGNQV